MTLILSTLGLFYVATAFFVLRRARLEWGAGSARMTPGFGNEPDRRRIYFMTVAAGLYGAAGLALLAKSDIAVWLLGGGLLVQAAYYGLARLDGDRGRSPPDGHAQQALSAAIVSAAAFAFAAYAARQGMLR